jgi:hypothetical protein
MTIRIRFGECCTHRDNVIQQRDMVKSFKRFIEGGLDICTGDYTVLHFIRFDADGLAKMVFLPHNKDIRKWEMYAKVESYEFLTSRGKTLKFKAWKATDNIKEATHISDIYPNA